MTASILTSRVYAPVLDIFLYYSTNKLQYAVRTTGDENKSITNGGCLRQKAIWKLRLMLRIEILIVTVSFDITIRRQMFRVRSSFLDIEW